MKHYQDKHPSLTKYSYRLAQQSDKKKQQEKDQDDVRLALLRNSFRDKEPKPFAMEMPGEYQLKKQQMA